MRVWEERQERAMAGLERSYEVFELRGCGVDATLACSAHGLSPAQIGGAEEAQVMCQAGSGAGGSPTAGGAAAEPAAAGPGCAPEAFDQALGDAQTAVEACYQRIADKMSLGPGSLTLSWHFDETGKAKTPEIARDGIRNQFLNQCVLGVTSNLRLPGGEGAPCQATRTFALGGQ